MRRMVHRLGRSRYNTAAMVVRDGNGRIDDDGAWLLGAWLRDLHQAPIRGRTPLPLTGNAAHGVAPSRTRS